jgi:hypothetical protein
VQSKPPVDWRTDPWDDDGHWQGPHDLGVFLRANAPFAAMWALVLFAIASVAISEFTRFHGWYAAAFGVMLGGAAWLLFMLGFAHGLIAEGD